MTSTGRPQGLWWLSPAGATVIVVVPSLLVAMALDDTRFRSAWDAARWLRTDYALLLLTGVAVFVLTSSVPLLLPRSPRGRSWPGLTVHVRQRLEDVAAVVFWITIAGYVAYLVVGIARGARLPDLLAVFSDEGNYAGNLKATFAPVPGVTTMTQFGIAYVVIAVLVLVDGPSPKVARRLAVVFGIALVRAFFLSERLAILELLLPAVAILGLAASRSVRPWLRRGTSWAPLLLAPLVALVFSIFEHSRSWVFYQGRSGGGFLQFALERFAGYYATAYNNGQVFFLFEPTAGRLPRRTLDALWTAPGLEQFGLYDRLSTQGFSTYAEVLTQTVNPEFNNSCGVCDPFLDWGVVGGLIWWAAAGLLLGLAYRSFCNADIRLLLLYPPLVTGLFEMPRYVYWAQGRLAPALVALLLVAWWVRRPERDSPVRVKDLMRT